MEERLMRVPIGVVYRLKRIGPRTGDLWNFASERLRMKEMRWRENS